MRTIVGRASHCLLLVGALQAGWCDTATSSDSYNPRLVNIGESSDSRFVFAVARVAKGGRRRGYLISVGDRKVMETYEDVIDIDFLGKKRFAVLDGHSRLGVYSLPRTYRYARYGLPGWNGRSRCWRQTTNGPEYLPLDLRQLVFQRSTETFIYDVGGWQLGFWKLGTADYSFLVVDAPDEGPKAQITLIATSNRSARYAVWVYDYVKADQEEHPDTIQIRESGENRIVCQVQPPTEYSLGMTLSDDGKRVAVVYAIGEGLQDRVECVAWRIDSRPKELFRWRSRPGRGRVPQSPYTRKVIDFSPLGDRAAIAFEGEIMIVDCDTGRLVKSIHSGMKRIEVLDWQGDGSIVVGASSDLRFVDPRTSREVARIVLGEGQRDWGSGLR